MRPSLWLRPASGESRFGESAQCQQVAGGSKGRSLGLRSSVIDRWREPTGQEPSLEGDEAGGDGEDTKDVLPDSYSVWPSKRGEQMPCFHLHNFSRGFDGSKEKQPHKKAPEEKLMLKGLACMLRQRRRYQDRRMF